MRRALVLLVGLAAVLPGCVFVPLVLRYHGVDMPNVEVNSYACPPDNLRFPYHGIYIHTRFATGSKSVLVSILVPNGNKAQFVTDRIVIETITDTGTTSQEISLATGTLTQLGPGALNNDTSKVPFNHLVMGATEIRKFLFHEKPYFNSLQFYGNGIDFPDKGWITYPSIKVNDVIYPPLKAPVRIFHHPTIGSIGGCV